MDEYDDEGEPLPLDMPEGWVRRGPSDHEADDIGGRLSLPVELAPLGDARLPAVYEAAKRELRALERIDLCKQWGDKAEALRAYAGMMHDPELEALAKRIRAWSARRAGELLAGIEPRHTGRPTAEIRTGARTNNQSRKATAEQAGLSKYQRDVALRVASIPIAKFEEMVEGDQPATLDQIESEARELRRKGAEAAAAETPQPPAVTADEPSPGLPFAVVGDEAMGLFGDHANAEDKAEIAALPSSATPKIELAGRTMEQHLAAQNLATVVASARFAVDCAGKIDLVNAPSGMTAANLNQIAAHLQWLRRWITEIETALGLDADA